MIDKNYNQKFRKFFEKFEKQYFLADSQEEKDFLWDLAVDFVEKNRDFVMQYPIVQYWKEIKKEDKNLEKIFFQEYNNKEINLYFHIPFCKTRCSYCSFHIVVGDKQKELMTQIYLTKLEKEIELFLENVGNFKIKTIFIGGGTPSYLEEKFLEKLLKNINEKFFPFFAKNLEFSFEGNPDSFNEKKLKILKNAGVNRLSFGVQTFDNKILKKINRTYTDNTVFDILNLAKKLGFGNINIDMIYGLPGHNYKIMKSDLEIVSKLEVEHITYYPLYYYDDAILSQVNAREDNIKQIYNFYDEVIDKLKSNGFEQYGREYFAKDGKISHYQNNFVGNGYLYGFGQSAYSFNEKYAFKKEVDLKKYIVSDYPLTHFFEYNEENYNRRLFVLGSRNIKIKKGKLKFEKSLVNFKKKIILLKSLNLIMEDKNYFILTDKGLKYQEVVAHILV